MNLSREISNLLSWIGEYRQHRRSVGFFVVFYSATTGLHGCEICTPKHLFPDRMASTAAKTATTMGLPLSQKHDFLSKIHSSRNTAYTYRRVFLWTACKIFKLIIMPNNMWASEGYHKVSKVHIPPLFILPCPACLLFNAIGSIFTPSSGWCIGGNCR